MAKVMVLRNPASGGPEDPPPPPPPPPPDPTGYTYSNSQTAIYQMPTVTMPALGGWYVDANFGGTVTRVSGPAQYYDPTTYALITEYSRFCPLSKDGTYIHLYNISVTNQYSSWWAVFNTSTGTRASPWIHSGGSGSAEFNWSPTDDTVGYFHRNNAYWRIDMPTGTITQLFTCTRANGTTYAYMNTGSEGRSSDDLRWHALWGKAYPSTVATTDWIMYDRLNNEIHARIPAPQYANWVGTTPLTGQFVAGGDSPNWNTVLYDRELNFVRRLSYLYSHGDIAIGSDGEEYYVYLAQIGGQLAEAGGEGLAWCRLSDGARAIVPGFRTAPRSALHISAICSRAHPDWILMSHYSSGTPNPFVRPGEHEVWFQNFITGEVKRVAHTHNFPDPAGGKDYWAETQATTDWSGETVIFKSNWGSVDPNKEIATYKVTGNFW